MSLSNDKIYNLYNNEFLSCAEIARADGRSESTVYNILKSMGNQFRSRSQANKIFPNFVLINLYNMGLSYSQIAKLLGIHASTVVKRFKRLGFPARPKSMANAIHYSDAEFKKFFFTEEILNDLTKLVK